MPERQEHFRTLLKANGLKVTTQRIVILEVLENRPNEHLTAEEIYDCVKEEHPEIGLATVYRTIQLLSELNLIERLNLDDGLTRYEIGKQGVGKECHHHHHLICLGCGKVLAFGEDLLEPLEQQIQDTMEFHITNHELKFYGYCNECKVKHI